jgi:predicted ATP-grasp superfamily ATP-dependent carboligase
MRKQKHHHFIEKTRKDHICGSCGEIIPKGSKAEYFNSFDGTRSFRHFFDGDCKPGFEKQLEKMRRINHPEDYT